MEDNLENYRVWRCNISPRKPIPENDGPNLIRANRNKNRFSYSSLQQEPQRIQQKTMMRIFVARRSREIMYQKE
jgi:hypothetical protein